MKPKYVSCINCLHTEQCFNLDPEDWPCYESFLDYCQSIENKQNRENKTK